MGDPWQSYRTMRFESGVPQVKVAARMGLTYETLSKYLNGHPWVAPTPEFDQAFRAAIEAEQVAV